MTQSENIRDFLEITKDSYREFHIKIVKPIEDKEFMKFVDEFSQQEIKLNQSKDLLTDTAAIWVYLTSSNLHLLPELCDRGFQMHSGKGKNISLYKFISKQKCLIPPFSMTYIACGAVLIKDQCIFLVQQKQGERKGCFGLPGGRADPNETIAQCAERQLRQQTNIKAKFKSIIAFREASPHLYGSLDIYFPCLMELSQDSFKQMKLCERQINSSKWVPLKDYHEFMLQHSTQTQKIVAQYITRLWKEGFDFEKMTSNITKFDRKQKASVLYKFDFHELITKI